MPAHLRPLARCEHPGCGKPATQELLNTWNAPTGRFCDRHVDAALAKFQREHPNA